MKIFLDSIGTVFGNIPKNERTSIRQRPEFSKFDTTFWDTIFFNIFFFGEDVAEDFDFAAHTRVSTGNDKFYTRFPIEKK